MSNKKMALATGTKQASVTDAIVQQSDKHKMQIQVGSKSYSLNIDKSLQKKLESARRIEIQFKYTGGGITATLDLATFELFIAAMSEYYDKYPSVHGNVKCQVDCDKSGIIVQKTYTVHIQMSTSYTINAYMTRTSFLINDNSVHYFLDNDLPAIHDMIKHAIYNGHHVDTH